MIAYGYGYGQPFAGRVPRMPARTRNKLLFYWTQDMDISSCPIVITNKDWSTSYIPATSTATFAIPDNATYIGADTDNFWHSGETILQKTTAHLVALDNARTFVWYDDEAPYHIRGMAMALEGATFDQVDHNNLSKGMRLWMYYFGVENDYGYLKENRPPAPDPYCAEFRVIYDYWTTKPSDSDALLYNTMIKDIVDTGRWAKLDMWEFFAVHSLDAVVDFKSTARVITYSVTPPTFTAFEGFLGVPANSTFIGTGWFPSSGVKFTKDNNAWGIYNRAARGAAAYSHGIYNNTGTKGLTMQFRSGSGNFLTFNNSAGAASQANANSSGMFIVRRDSATTVDLIRNSVIVGADKALNSNAVPTTELFLLCLDTDGTKSQFAPDQPACVFAGEYLDDDDCAYITTKVNDFLAAKGKAVI